MNLGELPPTGFKVACFPLKIEGGSAAPARVVGIVGDSEGGAQPGRWPGEHRTPEYT